MKTASQLSQMTSTYLSLSDDFGHSFYLVLNVCIDACTYALPAFTHVSPSSLHAFRYLKTEAKKLQAGFESRHDITTVGDMKKFVGNDLKGLTAKHKALAIHIGACENIISKATGERN